MFSWSSRRGQEKLRLSTYASCASSITSSTEPTLTLPLPGVLEERELMQRFRALGEVHPIVFGAYGEVSAGMEVLIGRLADAWAPQIAGKYLLDNVLAAKGIAKSILREEIGAASTHMHTSSLGARSSASRATARRAAPGPGREVQQSSRATPRAGGTGHLVVCGMPYAPVAVGFGESVIHRCRVLLVLSAVFVGFCSWINQRFGVSVLQRFQPCAPSITIAVVVVAAVAAETPATSSNTADGAVSFVVRAAFLKQQPRVQCRSTIVAMPCALALLPIPLALH
jgi:hypothetical protein